MLSCVAFYKLAAAEEIVVRFMTHGGILYRIKTHLEGRLQLRWRWVETKMLQNAVPS